LKILHLFLFFPAKSEVSSWHKLLFAIVAAETYLNAKHRETEHCHRAEVLFISFLSQLNLEIFALHLPVFNLNVKVCAQTDFPREFFL